MVSKILKNHGIVEVNSLFENTTSNYYLMLIGTFVSYFLANSYEIDDKIKFQNWRRT